MVATAPTKGMVALKEQVQGKVTSIGQNVAKQLQGGESTSGGQQKAQQAAGNCELKKLSHSQGARPSAPPSPAGGKSSGSGTPPKTSPSRSCIIAPDFPPEVQAGVARLEAVAKKVQPPSGEKKKIPAVLNDQLHSDVAVFTSYCEMGRSAAAKLVADLMRFMDPFTSKENLRKKFMSKRSTQGEETAREREKTLNRVKGKLHRAIQDRMLAAKREESGPSPSHKNEPANNEDDDFQSPQGTKPRGRSRNLPWNKKIQRLLYDAVSAHQKRRDAGDEVAESILGELLSYWPPGCVTEEAMMQNILKERRRRESAAALAEKASQSQPTAETKTVQNSQPGGENSQPGNTQGLPPRRQSTTEPEHQDGVAVRGSQDANKVNGASQIQNPVAAAPVHSPVAAIPTSGQSSQTPI
ncbi:unnamed protein product [Ostreobium quekettii]|uniref:Uncharacterized protein n=1 Tax=Ostreobium quekettii TaxID=121088 RepID=A0A8S1IMI8_9CHLO|nr:unnamed protein product [Ostreobium quekettii]|eukprot:evm.model.scf_680.2 EVM.evm.TU.scf_680.2   scf_680:16578-22980(-)